MEDVTLILITNATEAKKGTFVRGYKDVIRNDRAEPGLRPMFFILNEELLK